MHTTSYSYETNRDLKTDVQNGGYSSYAYRYDAIGRRTDRVQSGSAFAQASFDAFGYNTRSEVIDSKRYLGTDPTDSSSPVVADVFAYDFDPIGNRLSASTAGASESYATNELNQYLSAGPKTFTHDADGNLTHDGNRNFTWTAENRLKSVEPVVLLSGAEKTEFEYDYLGRRIQKTVSEWNGSFYAVTSDEKFLYDGWNLVAVYDATKSNALTKTHTWGLDLSQSLQGAGGVGGLLGVEELSGTHRGVYHFALDANGNVTEVIDDSGSIAAHYEYSLFGQTVRSSGAYADENPFRFSTKYLDVETGFYYYGYRHYNPATGRWLSKDPLQEAGGANLYHFAFNDSINNIDYLGLIIEYGNRTSRRAAYEVRNSGPTNRSNFDQLLNSSNTHSIDTTSGASVNTTTGNVANESNGIGTGSSTTWNPDGHGGFSGESVLAHELQHAADKDSGTIEPRDPLTNQRPDNDGNGYPDSEDRAVDTGNEYRNSQGERTRDDYGDGSPDPNSRNYDKNKKFDPNDPFNQGKQSCSV